jgi:catechol 2,3-dioxygenase-like lactoylglutathione lyase family enzyme/extradiol dioxygenase family protein
MNMRLLVLVGCLALSSTPAVAQLAPPNDIGVALGHIHLVVKNVDAQKEFWTTMLGGTLVTNGPLTLIQFPGVFIMLRQGEPTGPSAGSIVNHFGFVYKDLTAARARWKTAGVKFDVGETNPNQGYVYAPDSAIRIHVYPPQADIPVIQAWYAKVFGGIPGKRQRVALPGLTDCDYFHRFNMSFSAGEGQLAATKGRELDHLGFDVKDIEQFEKHLVAQGLKFEAPPRQVPNTQTKVAFLTDPWGTYIEVTEHLAPY